jgi:hypothetical protein
MVAAGIIGGVSALGSIVGGIFGSSAAKRRQREAAREKKKLTAKLTSLENSRQAIINPYSGAKDLSSMAQDLSNQMSNPFASLGVATQAAEIQMEQTDIALANTLDTLRSTGASAGGATALAQAALQSKKGVAASIEQQEAANEKLKAQGEQQLQNMQVSEQQRLQNIQIGEGQRVQNADAAGKSFVFNAKDRREAGQLDRVSAQLSGAQGREAQAASDRTAAVTGAIGGVTSAVGSMATAYSAYGTMNAVK